MALFVRAKASLAAYLAADVATFLWGAPGVGKSDMVRAVASEMGVRVLDVRASMLDPVDIRGLPYVEGGRARWAVPSFLPDAARDGERGILFLDELNAAPKATQVACYQLVWDRAVGEYRLPQGWHVVAAGNRREDRAAANTMPSALANRAAHIDVDADLDSWVSWSAGQGISPYMVAFLRFRPALFHDMPKGEVREFPSPRTWAMAARVMHAAPGIRGDLVRGLVGAPAGNELLAFLDLAADLPSVRSILDDPHGAKLPTSPSGRYAITAALASAADTKNFGAIVAYLRRLPKEIEAMGMLDATRMKPALMGTSAFIQWGADNADVMA